MDKAVNDIIVNGSDVHKFMNTVCSRVVNHNWDDRLGHLALNEYLGLAPLISSRVRLSYTVYSSASLTCTSSLDL